MGALLGAALAGGVLVIVTRLASLRSPTLRSRVDPYLPGRRLAAGVPTAQVTPFSTLESVVAPTLREFARALDGWMGSRRALVLRLERAGRTPDADAFRLQQAFGGAAAGVVAALVVVLLAITGTGPAPIPAVVLVALAVVGGVIVVEQSLDRAISRRRESMVAELPTIAELLALSVAAGEGVVGAIERVSVVGRGVLPSELARAVSEVRTGTSVGDALAGVAERTSHPAVGRFVDGVVIAVERGTPLAEVLRAQATDVRDAGRRELMETAGKREIAMMVPVVFLVMPVTVLFALFPGFFGLSLTV
jgi:tight adherence protein C